MEYNEEHPVLIAQAGPLEGQRWTIQTELVIGRDPDCDLVILTPDKQVSRRHAVLRNKDNQIILQDLSSKNGTHHNGQLINEAVTLKDGDTIQIAMAQQLVFLSSDATVPLEMSAAHEMPLAQGLLRLDKRARRVWIGSLEVSPPLSVAQFTMLQLLVEAGTRVITRHELVEAIWGEEHAYEVSNQALDALVRRLRDRLAELNNEHEFIVTVRGHGLRLDNPQ